MTDLQKQKLAFGLTWAAAAAGSLGAALVFLPKKTILNRKTLGRSMAFSAGVMLYISLVDLMAQAYQLLLNHFGNDKANFAYFSMTGSFFCGMTITAILDLLVHMMYKEPDLEDVVGDHLEAISRKSINQLQISGGLVENGLSLPIDERVEVNVSGLSPDPEDGRSQSEQDHEKPESKLASKDREKFAITRTAIVTGIALMIHHFPEGVATFVTASVDIKVGVPVAVAIACHSVPEGLAVAVPTYHAYGSRWKAWLAGTLAAITEPLGAAFAWAAFSGGVSYLVLGLITAAVAGVMVFVSVSELLPIAYRFEAKAEMITSFMVAGMILMAASLILFML